MHPYDGDKYGLIATKPLAIIKAIITSGIV